MQDERVNSDLPEGASAPEDDATERPDESGNVYKEALDAIAETAKRAGSGTSQLVKATQKYLPGDDLDRIEAECTYLASFTRQKLAVIPSHLVQGFAAAGVAAGLLSLETPILRFTRSHMDVDNGVFQALWRQVFPRTDVTQAVNAFMDQVPGWSFAGGMHHRVHHGHDLNALVQIMQDHGAEGTMQWLNHVALRDFWTPHGVPYLPGGSSSVYDWLVSMNVGKAVAADLLTINAVEFFAGLSAIRLAFVAHRVYKEIKRNAAIKKHWQEGERRDASGNLEGALSSYMIAYDLSGRDVRFGLQLALRHLDTASQHEPGVATELLDNAHSLATGILVGASTGPTDTIGFQGGTRISLRGLAGYILVAGLPGAAARGAVKQLPDGQLRDSISSFRETAASLRRRPGLAGDMSISAALNDLLALELSVHLPSDRDASLPSTIRSELLNELRPVSDPDKRAGRYMRRLIRGIEQKYPLSLPASSH